MRGLSVYGYVRAHYKNERRMYSWNRDYFSDSSNIVSVSYIKHNRIGVKVAMRATPLRERQHELASKNKARERLRENVVKYRL